MFFFSHFPVRQAFKTAASRNPRRFLKEFLWGITISPLPGFSTFCDCLHTHHETSTQSILNSLVVQGEFLSVHLNIVLIKIRLSFFPARVSQHFNIDLHCFLCCFHHNEQIILFAIDLSFLLSLFLIRNLGLRKRPSLCAARDVSPSPWRRVARTPRNEERRLFALVKILKEPQFKPLTACVINLS